MDPVVWLIVGVGVLLSAVSVPLWRGRVQPNRLYGFRTPRLTSDPRVWYPANKVMGRDLFFAGIAVVVGTLVLGAVTPVGTEPALLPLLSVILGPILAAVLHSFYFASALVAELDGLTAAAAQSDDARRARARAKADHLRV